MSRQVTITYKDELSSDELFELLIDGIRKIPSHLQMMVDSVVAMQECFPMPEENWEAFKRDIEHTNQKHGFNLKIRGIDSDQTSNPQL